MTDSQLNALHDKIDDGFRAVDRQYRALDSRLAGMEARLAGMEGTLDQVASLLLRPGEVSAVRATTSRADNFGESPPSPRP